MLPQTLDSAFDAFEGWCFMFTILLVCTRIHDLRQQCPGHHRSLLRRRLTSALESLPEGITTIEQEFRQTDLFQKRSRWQRWTFYALSAVGLIISLCSAESSPFLPGCLVLLWCYDARLTGEHALRVRWLAVSATFGITFMFLLSELFRFAAGAQFTMVDWGYVVVIVALCTLTGFMPGKPAREAVGGLVVELAYADDEEADDDDSARHPTMAIAPTDLMQNSVLGILFFGHVYPLVRCAVKTGSLRSTDVPVLGDSLQAEYLANRVRRHFRRHIQAVQQDGFEQDDDEDDVSDEEAHLLLSTPAPQPRLFSRATLGLLGVLLRANAALFATMIVLTILAVLMYYAPALCANRIFTLLEDGVPRTPRERFGDAAPWVLALFFTVIFSSTLQGALWSLLEGSLTIRLTTQLSALLFGKALTRRQDAGAENSRVLTLHLVDVGRVVAIAFHLFALFTSPLELLVGGYFAYRVLGVSALVGLASTVLLMPLIGVLSHRFAQANEKLMGTRDQRMGQLNEVFTGIRMIKSQAWERRFDARIGQTRSKELDAQKTSFVLEAMLSTVLEVNPLLVTLVAFTWYTLVLGHELVPKTAFTALAVFNEMRWTITMIPEAMTRLVQTLVSARRISEYLYGQDVASVRTSDMETQRDVRLVNATVAWPHTGTPTFALTDVSLTFSPGSKTLVCGRVGAGKSLLLQALLHEAHVLRGTVDCPRSPSTGIPYDALTHSSALTALSSPAWLRSDLVAYAPQTPFLLHTTIRENILFGLPMGDGARYAAVLDACALHSDLAQMMHGDLTEVGEGGAELSGGQKARVGLARALYSRARLVLLDDVLSAVDASTARHLAEHALAGPLLESRTLVLVSHNVQLVGRLVDQVVLLKAGRVEFCGTPQKFLASDECDELLKGDAEDVCDQPKAATAPPAAPRRTEHRETGSIAFRVWRAYIEASSGWALCLVTMLLFALSNLWELVTNGWLRDWSAASDTHTSAWWLSRYAALVMLGIAFGVLRWVGMYTMSLRASRVLFGQMLWRTLRAPLRFFDTMSRGRLLNRFGQDLEVLDAVFAQAIASVVIRITQLLATTIALGLVGGWPFVVALLILLPLYGFIAQAYIAAARDLQRLTSTSRSHVVSAFGNVVHGAVVVRAFGAQKRFTATMYGVLDNNNRFVWWTAQGGRWVSQMFNLISSMLMLAACAFILLNPAADAPRADFAMLFLINLNFVLLILMRMYTALQTNAVAVERVFEYAATIEQEAAEHTTTPPPPSWPSGGHVHVSDLVLRYAPTAPDVLHRVSFDVPPGSKLAIVGPTGSGKTTLLSAFLRFIEPATGRIEIDGVDIASIGLHDLRSRLQMVPQDPVITSGSLRNALDVLDEYSDEQLLESLRAVQLITPECDTFANLDYQIAENGTNLSQGQRQLLCMARAILCHSHLVLFDEASSSIDHDTEMRLNDVVQDAFHNSTIITIAHRLRSVIYYDRILFLDQGRIAEMGEPATLLRDPNSRLRKLCEKTGASEFATLAKAAEDAATRRRSQAD